MRRSRIILLVGAVMALTFSCKTPQEKLAKLVDKYPSLERDTTLIDWDTTIIDIPAVHADSVIHINTIMHDTFILEKEHLRIQTIYRNDSVFIEGDCFGIKDTIVSMEEIHTKYIVNNKEGGFDWQRFLIGALLGAFITLLIIFKFKK